MIAREIMNTDLAVVEPDLPVRDVARLLVQRHISGVPVVDDGVLMGIITESDLVGRAKKVHLPTLFTILDAVIPLGGERQYEDDLRHITAATARDIMTAELTVVGPDATLAELATIMSEEHVPLLPVVDENGTLLGLIGKREVIRAMLSEERD
ncbi:MAG: CBS domain-containing protein [Magnetococcus sp. WYHC-3]